MKASRLRTLSGLLAALLVGPLAGDLPAGGRAAPGLIAVGSPTAVTSDARVIEAYLGRAYAG